MKLSLKHLIVAGVAVAALIFFLWPSDEKVVRSRLKSLAQEVTKNDKESDIEAAGRALKIGNYFTPKAILRAGAPVPDLEGQQAIKQAALVGRGSVSSIWVDFVDVSMIFESSTSVVVECTGQGRVQEMGNERGFQARYLEIRMIKESGNWLISEMKEVKALQ